MAKKNAVKANEVVKLPAVFKTDNSRNTQLYNGIHGRYPDVTLHFKNEDGEVVDVPFISGGTPAEGLHPETVQTVYAAVIGMSSRTSGGGDGAVLWLDENMRHKRVATILRDGNEISFSLGSSRSGYAGYRWTAEAIKKAVAVLAPVMLASMQEFGLPAPDIRTGKQDDDQFEDVQWDVF